mmetsp:Transcript_4114/g.11708  ORF Transcript_4114/g.11708 Transcript_4114/m.11708 type:complete len:428 (-) Transcript_4114:39-1322(-)
MRLAALPLAVEHAPIGPREAALTLLLVAEVLPLVPRAVGPYHLAAALHVAGVPLAAVGPAVGELVAPLALHRIVGVLALVLDAGAGAVYACAVLAAHPKLALVSRAVGVVLDASARLGVLAPFALVDTPIDVDVLPVAVHPVPLPLAIVRAPVAPDEDATPVRLAVNEETLVAHAVHPPLQHALPVADLPVPLAGVGVAVLHLDLRALLQKVDLGLHGHPDESYQRRPGRVVELLPGVLRGVRTLLLRVRLNTLRLQHLLLQALLMQLLLLLLQEELLLLLLLHLERLLFPQLLLSKLLLLFMELLLMLLLSCHGGEGQLVLRVLLVLLGPPRPSGAALVVEVVADPQRPRGLNGFFLEVPLPRQAALAAAIREVVAVRAARTAVDGVEEGSDSRVRVILHRAGPSRRAERMPPAPTRRWLARASRP